MVLLAAQRSAVDVEYHAGLESLTAAGAVDALLRYRGVETVAIERFTIAPRTITGSRTGSLDALYTIGAVRYLCDREHIPLHLQTPAAAKNALSDERLCDLGLRGATVGPHERDALRHALLLSMTLRVWHGAIVRDLEEVP